MYYHALHGGGEEEEVNKSGEILNGNDGGKVLKLRCCDFHGCDVAVKVNVDGGCGGVILCEKDELLDGKHDGESLT